MKSIILVLFLIGFMIFVYYLDHKELTYDQFKAQLETELRHNSSKQPFLVGNMHVTPSFEENVFIIRLGKQNVTYAGAGDQGERRVWEK